MVRRRMVVLSWCLLAYLARIPVGAAQSTTALTKAPASPPDHQEGVLSPRRIPGLYTDTNILPANVTVITAEELRRLGASTIQEAIARTPGVTFSDQQGFGLASDGTLNLRGVVNSSRTNALVLVDGIRQNRITGDEVHWQSIPVDQVERIEILRGSSGLIYGEGALAGVINIVTKQTSEQLVESDVAVERGAYGWEKYAVSTRGRSQPLTYGVNYTRQLVTGYRESSWSRNTTITTHNSFRPTDSINAAVHVLHSEDTTAFPGGLTQTQTDQHRRQTNSFHGFNTNEIDQVSLDLVGGPWDGLSTLVNLYWRRWEQRSQDSIDFNSFTITPSRGLSVRTNAAWTGTFAQNLFINGLELSDDKATSGDRDAFPGPDNESNRKGYGLYFEDLLTLWDRLTFDTGVRLDKSRYQEAITNPSFLGTLQFQGFSPKAGITFTALPHTLDLFASYARPFKAPNIDDLTARVPSFSGNVNLKPQQADTYELGARVTHRPITGEATWFYARTADEILSNPFTFQNQNFDTRRLGVEFATRLELPEHGLRGYTTYTFVNAEFRKGQYAGKLVPGTPRHTLHAGLGASPLTSLWINLDWELVSDFFRINDLDNSLGKAKSYGVLNLVVTYDVPTHLIARGAPATTAFLKIANITNEEYVTFQSSNGSNLNGAGQYPMPPTMFTGGVSVQF